MMSWKEYHLRQKFTNEFYEKFHSFEKRYVTLDAKFDVLIP